MTDRPETLREKTHRRAGLITDALTRNGTTPGGWLAAVLAEAGQVEHDRARNRLMALLPRKEREPAAADEVLATALAELGPKKAYVSQPMGEATFLVAGPKPNTPKGPNWVKDTTRKGPDLDRERLRQVVATTQTKTERETASAELAQARALRAEAVSHRIKAARSQAQASLGPGYEVTGYNPVTRKATARRRK